MAKGKTIIQKRPLTAILHNPDITAADTDASRGGNYAHAISDEMREHVAMMASVGMNNEVIAKIFHIDLWCLRKHFPLELAHGRDLAMAKVAGKLYTTATKGQGRESVEAGKFWLQAKCGWRITNVQEVSGADGKPIEVSAEFKGLTDEERAVRLLQVLNKLGVGRAGSTDTKST